MNLAIHKKLMLAMIQSTPDNSLLPREYQEVEYIESTGTQYIDTGYIFGNATPTFKFKIYLDENSFGKTIWGNENMTLYPYNNSQIQSTYNGRNTVISDITFGWHDIELGKDYFACDDIRITFSLRIRENTTSLYLFGRNRDTSLILSSSRYRLYEVYEDESCVTPIQQFIPCYRKSDGVVGMYDLCGSICPLTGTPFYINAGEGEFLKGADI